MSKIKYFIVGAIQHTNIIFWPYPNNHWPKPKFSQKLRKYYETIGRTVRLVTICKALSLITVIVYRVATPKTPKACIRKPSFHLHTV